MLVKIEARILIFPGTDFHFPSTSVPPGTFLGSGRPSRLRNDDRRWTRVITRRARADVRQLAAAAAASVHFTPIVCQLYDCSCSAAHVHSVVIIVIIMIRYERYDTRCYFNVRSKADMSQLNLQHRNDN